MAVLTWKNVDAPNLNGAGALIEGSTNSFNAAMDNLRVNAERAAAQRRSGYSSRALAGLAGVQNAEDVGSYIQSLNAEELTPEALSVMMQQPGVLLERSAKQVALDDARGDFQYEQDTRAGALQAAAARAEAQRLSVLGDRQGALDILQGLDGYAALSALDDFGSIGSNYGQFQTQRENEYNFGRKVDEDNAREQGALIADDLLNKVYDRKEAEKLIIENKELSPQVQRAALTALNDFSDEQIQRKEEGDMGLFDPSVFPNLTAAASDNARDAEFINADIRNRRQAEPLVAFQDSLNAIQEGAGDPTKGKQTVSDLLAARGISVSSGLGVSGPNAIINNIKTELEKEGIRVSDEEIVAAVDTTARVSWLPWDDTLVENTDAVKDILRRAKDPEEMAKVLDEANKYETITTKLSDLDAKIARANDQFTVYAGKGQTDKAIKAREAAEKLLEEQRKIISSHQEEIRRERAKAAADNPGPNYRALPEFGPEMPQQIVDEVAIFNNARASSPVPNAMVAPLGSASPNDLLLQQLAREAEMRRKYPQDLRAR